MGTTEPSNSSKSYGTDITSSDTNNIDVESTRYFNSVHSQGFDSSQSILSLIESNSSSTTHSSLPPPSSSAEPTVEAGLEEFMQQAFFNNTTAKKKIGKKAAKTGKAATKIDKSSVRSKEIIKGTSNTHESSPEKYQVGSYERLQEESSLVKSLKYCLDKVDEEVSGAEIHKDLVGSRHPKLPVEDRNSLDNNHGSSLDNNYGSSLDNNHGSSLDNNHGSSLHNNHGSSLDNNHGSSLDNNHGSSCDCVDCDDLDYLHGFVNGHPYGIK